MPLQNRVQPNGDIIATPARGTFTGNRGIIHREDKTLGTSRWSHHAWICCTLEWQGRKREVMTGRNWTELFFLDEAVAIAAGHRPCGYCRRAAYKAFVQAWGDGEVSVPKAPEMDRGLHGARVDSQSRKQRTFLANLDDLPAGCFINIKGIPHLVQPDALVPYRSDGYLAAHPKPQNITVEALTPAPMIKVLRSGYAPALHASAGT